MDFEKPQDYVDELKRLDGCLRELAGDGFTRGPYYRPGGLYLHRDGNGQRGRTAF